MRVEEAIRQLIQEKGMKQTFIAKKLKVLPNTVSQTLLGKRKLSADELMKYCEILDLSPQDLYEYANNKSN